MSCIIMKRRPPHSTSAPSLIERPLMGAHDHASPGIQRTPSRILFASFWRLLLGQSHPLRGLTVAAVRTYIVIERLASLRKGALTAVAVILATAVSIFTAIDHAQSAGAHSTSSATGLLSSPTPQAAGTSRP
jgi:hypothetical protein